MMSLMRKVKARIARMILSLMMEANNIAIMNRFRV